MTKQRPPFKCHGGKWYLHQWIISNFPPNYTEMNYLESFIGAGSVFINKNKPINRIEIINDIDVGIIEVFKALRDDSHNFIKKLNELKYQKETFEEELNKKCFNSFLDRAVNEFVLRRMSRGGLKKTFAWSNRERGGKPGDVNAWETILKELPLISNRLENVIIANNDAINVIEKFDDKNTLLYADPPYVPESRISKNAYEHEMTTEDHIALSNVLHNFSGKVLISGYPSSLYNRLYNSWRYIEYKIVNHASQQKVKEYKTECLWLNY